jgi:hypothetical protein
MLLSSKASGQASIAKRPAGSGHRHRTVVARSAVQAPGAETTGAQKKVSIVSLGCPKNVVDGKQLHSHHVWTCSPVKQAVH